MRLIRLLKNDLASEANHWVQEGLLTSDQSDSILARYGTSLEQPDRKGFGYYVLQGLAALCCGIAVLLLVSHNWAELGRGTRIIFLISSTLGLNLFGFSAWRAGRLDLARVLFIVGSLMYGATIYLIAQIYHLVVDFPPGILWWTLGILPIALASESIVIALISIVLATLWMFFSCFNPHAIAAINPLNKDQLIPSQVYLLYPLLVAAVFFFAIRIKKSLALFLLATVATLFFSELVLTDMIEKKDVGVTHIVYTIGLQLILYCLGGLLERSAKDESIVDYGIVLRLWAMRFTVFTLFAFSFDVTWKGFIQVVAKNPSTVVNTTFAMSLLAIFLLCLTRPLAIRPSKHLGSHVPQAVTFIAIYLAMMLFSTQAEVSQFHYKVESSAATLGTLAANALLIVVAIWYIAKGIAAERSSEVLFGTFIILTLSLIRYFDLIGGYVGTATLFLVEAGIMFAVARAMRSFSFRKTEVIA